MVDTKLSVREIQLAIINGSGLCDYRNDIIVPNVSWGLLPYEADLLVVRKSGTTIEFEIKRSFQDFKKDFEKFHTHNAEIITYFYYVVPEKIVDKVKSYLMDKYQNPEDYPAVLTYTDEGYIGRMCYSEGDYGKEKHKHYVKITEEQKATLGRLASIRYWNIINEVSPNGKSMKDLKIKSLNETIKTLEDENDKLYKMNGSGRWVYCSKEYPSDDREVIVRSWNGYHYIAYYDKEKKTWYKVNCGDDNKEITRYIHSWTDIPAFQN